MMLQVVSLAEDLLRGLPPDVASSMILAFGNIEAALLASTKLQNQIIALDDVPEEPLAGPLLIVEPSVAQVFEAHFLRRSCPSQRMMKQDILTSCLDTCKRSAKFEL